MLTPPYYWRIAKPLTELESLPDASIALPICLTEQQRPPMPGDGLLLADYDRDTQIGLVRALGIIGRREGNEAKVDWRNVAADIWVDTPAGRGNWATKDGFRFAATKVAGYGLHHLFAEQFPDLTPREELPAGATGVRRSRRLGVIAPERLKPTEIVGEPSGTSRGGYVYVLKSAYGYKVGRTRNVPSRMRAFGVHLPILYSIPLCAWFDDHLEAESRYHQLFAEKRINGEWFDLKDDDLALIRQRTFGPPALMA